MGQTLLGIIYFIAVSHGLMLAVSLWRKSGAGQSGRWLSIITLLMSYKLLEGGLMYTGLYLKFAHIMDLLPGVVLIIGPLIYAYVTHVTGKAKVPLWQLILHFIPAIAIWLRNSPQVFRSLEEKVTMWDQIVGPSFGNELPWQIITLLLAIKAHLSLYLFFSWRTMYTYEKASRELRADNSQQVISHIRIAIAAFFLLEIVWVALFLGQQFLGIGTLGSVSSIWLLLIATIVLSMGYIGLQNPKLIFTQEERSLTIQQLESNESVEGGNVKYLYSALPENTGEVLAKEVELKLQDGQLYLEDKLTLTDLAKATGIKTHTLSQVINQTMKTNFYRLINGYRVQHAVELIENTQLNWPLERIAYESGFSNRVTFNKAFKEIMDCTPSRFKKGLSDAV